MATFVTCVCYIFCVLFFVILELSVEFVFCPFHFLLVSLAQVVSKLFVLDDVHFEPALGLLAKVSVLLPQVLELGKSFSNELVGPQLRHAPKWNDNLLKRAQNHFVIFTIGVVQHVVYQIDCVQPHVKPGFKIREIFKEDGSIRKCNRTEQCFFGN